MLLATEAGLGNGETPIFPIQIFQREGGRQLQPRRPQLRPVQAGHAVLSAKRLFPNFCFLDAPFNLQYYKPGHPETEIAYMGCRTRVMGNVYDPDRRDQPTAAATCRFTSINLPRLAIEAKGDVDAVLRGAGRE